MRITFVYPPIPYRFAQTPYPPLGIGYLAAAIERECPFVRDIYLLDGQILPEEYFWSTLQKIEADVFLISATLRQMKKAKESASVIKKYCPESIVILGGPGPSSLATYQPNFLDGTNVDVAVIGESEIILPRLLRKLYMAQNLDDLPNLVIRDKERTWHTKRTIEYIDMHSIPWPNRDLFDYSAYRKRWLDSVGLFSVHLLGSRGCPFGCAFCDVTITGRRVRYRNIEDVVQEMLFLEKKYKPDDIFFFDDTFTVNKSRVIAMCNLMRLKGLHTSWSAQARIDLIDLEMLQSMKSAGCEEIYFGVESGSERILKILNKRITPEQIVKAFDICHQVGIRPGAYLIVGVPGETRDDILKTCDLIRRIRPGLLNFSILTPFPNTAIYERTKHLIDTWDFEAWDDFGVRSVYNIYFDIPPREAVNMIRQAHLESTSNSQLSPFQFGDMEYTRVVKRRRYDD